MRKNSEKMEFLFNATCILTLLVMPSILAEIRTITTPIRQFGYGQLLSTAMSPDGTKMLTGSADAQARLWDLETGEVIRVFTGHEHWVWSVAFSPDGMMILTGSEDKTAKLWDMETGHVIRTFSGHTDVLRSVAFSRDGHRILTASEDGTAKLWDMDTGLETQTYSGHASAVYFAAFSPDATQILTGSTDKTTRLWDVETGLELWSYTFGKTVNAGAFNPDGTQYIVATQGGMVVPFDTATRQPGFGIATATTTPIAFSTDGTEFLIANSDSVISIYNKNSEFIRSFNGHTARPNFLGFTPDGAQLLTTTFDNQQILWDSSAGTQVRIFSGHSSFMETVRFSPDETKIITGGTDSSVILWDFETAEELRIYSGQTDPILSVAISPDGSKVAAGAKDNKAIVWDLYTGATVLDFQNLLYGNVFSFFRNSESLLSAFYSILFISPPVFHVVQIDVLTGEPLKSIGLSNSCAVSGNLSSDESKVVIGWSHGLVEQYDLSSNTLIGHYDSGNYDNLVSAAYADNDSKIVAGYESNTVKIWDSASGILLNTPRIPTEQVSCMAFSLDGKKMVSGYYMRNIAEVFDLISGFKLCNIKCDCTGMKDIALSSDGNTLLSCADDGSAKLWDLSDIGNGVFHSADTNRDGKISLAELLRVIQFFNMGGYACANGETSDGYIPGPGTVHSCTRHSSDFDATEWVISLSELLRLVQFFNMSGYHPCSDVSAEDGFCPGPQE